MRYFIVLLNWMTSSAFHVGISKNKMSFGYLLCLGYLRSCKHNVERTGEKKPNRQQSKIKKDEVQG